MPPTLSVPWWAPLWAMWGEVLHKHTPRVGPVLPQGLHAKGWDRGLQYGHKAEGSSKTSPFAAHGLLLHLSWFTTKPLLENCGDDLRETGAVGRQIWGGLSSSC